MSESRCTVHTLGSTWKYKEVHGSTGNYLKILGSTHGWKSGVQKID